MTVVRGWEFSELSDAAVTSTQAGKFGHTCEPLDLDRMFANDCWNDFDETGHLGTVYVYLRWEVVGCGQKATSADHRNVT